MVVRLPLTDLYPFPDHPFQVRDDEEMKETIQSVKEYGVIVPAIVRPREEGWYYSQTKKAVLIKYPNPRKDTVLTVSFEDFDLIGM